MFDLDLVIECAIMGCTLIPSMLIPEETSTTSFYSNPIIREERVKVNTEIGTEMWQIVQFFTHH